MKKKRVLAALLMGCMLALCGCQSTDRGVVVKEQETVEATEETQEETSVEIEEGEEDPGILQITFYPEVEDDYDPGSGQWLLNTEYQRIEAKGGSEKAVQAIGQWSQKRVEEIKNARAQGVIAALGEEQTTDYYRYSIYESLRAARIDRRVVSLVEQNSEYTGGAHGNYGSSGVNFDAETGELLTLSDLLTDEEGFQELLRQGSVIEARAYHTCLGLWRYFTVADEGIDLKAHSYVMIATLEAYEQIQKVYGADKVLPVLIELDDGVRLQRALDREKAQDQPKYEEMCRRFLADAEDFSEEKVQKAGIDRRFYNDELDSCLEEIIVYLREKL